VTDPMTGGELRDALDGLFAYGVGATDSGIHDEDLRARCIARLSEMRPAEIRSMIREMRLTPAALAGGYGIEDAEELRMWLRDDMGCGGKA
jgi:hypothetical protein